MSPTGTPLGRRWVEQSTLETLVRTEARKMARTTEFFALRSLRAKFLALIVPLVLLSTVIVFGISELAARREANRKLHGKLDELVEIQSAVLSEPVWNVADEQIELILAAIAIDTDVLGAIVYDETNNPLGAVGSARQRKFCVEH